MNVAPAMQDSRVQYPTKVGLDKVASAQYGLVSRTQAIEIISVQQLRTMVARGDLMRIRRGVYRFRGAPPTWEQALLAAVMAGPPGTVAAGPAAGRLWRLMTCERASVEVTSPYGSTINVRRHRSSSIEPSSTILDGIPVTSIERTLIDLSAHRSYESYARLLEDALDRGLTSTAAITSTLRDIGSQGRGRTARLRELLDLHGEGIEEIDSALHRKVVAWLNNAGITGFVNEYELVVGSRRRRIDIAWPDELIAIEVDGYAFHRRRDTFDDDRSRNNWLLVNGWRVLHVTSKTSRSELLRWLWLTRQARSGPSLSASFQKRSQ